MKNLLFITIILACTLTHVFAKDNFEEGEGASARVQYTLILPDEKTPELVKPEENNPFEAAADLEADKEGDTEENQVRDMLLRMPVGGGVSGSNGMRVMLGGMRLEAGVEVPPILPDQQVTLRVKSITPSAIELIWIEKKPTGLPPKSLVIPIDSAPSVRYQMPAGMGSQNGQGSGQSMGTMRKNGVSAFAPPPPVQEEPQRAIARAEPVAETQPAPAPPSPKATAPASSPASDVPEASVLRMLFGNRPPAAK